MENGSTLSAKADMKKQKTFLTFFAKKTGKNTAMHIISGIMRDIFNTRTKTFPKKAII